MTRSSALTFLLVGLALTAFSACQNEEAGRPAVGSTKTAASAAKSQEYLEREQFLTEVKAEVTALDPGVGSLWEKLEARAREARGEDLAAIQRDLAQIRSWRTGIEKDFVLITDMNQREWKESAMRVRRGIARLRALAGEPARRGLAGSSERADGRLQR